MSIRSLVRALFAERQNMYVTFKLPTKLIVATETVAYLWSSTSEEQVNRDQVVTHALAEFLQRELVDKTPPEPEPPPTSEDYRFTSGRRQAR